jgi:hypothetical protein
MRKARARSWAVLGASEWTITRTEVGRSRIEVRGCDHWTIGDDDLIVKKDGFWKLREP